jgi:hypothetical protein
VHSTVWRDDNYGELGPWATTPNVEGVCISVAVSILKRPQCGWVGVKRLVPIRNKRD